MNSILIVEDDEKLRMELGIFLGNNGYSIKQMENFDNPISEILNSKCDLVLLDINLPGSDGQYICKEVRKTSDVPIIIITSRDTELDELISINYGADDFVTKPFNSQILLARISSILKRINKSGNDKINCNEFILNTSKSTIEKEGREIELTKNEFKILYYLATKRNAIVSRDEIITYLWEGEMFVDDNTLTVNINRLRKKLQDINLKNIIETKRGQGYILK